MYQKVLLGFSLVLMMSACAGTPQAKTEVTVEATDFAYNPVSITIPVGQPVTLLLENNGKVEHDFVIEKINVTDVDSLPFRCC